LKVTLLGFGNIGMAVAQALADQAGGLGGRGLKMELVAVVDSRSAAVDEKGLDPASLVAKKKSTGRVGEPGKNALEVIRETESDVVLELTPANPKDGEPALSHMKEALRASRHVVTANKVPLALHYSDLAHEAGNRGIRILYGACVGAGLPVLEVGRICAEAEPIQGIDGVLNATSNFVLTKMEEDGLDYDSALSEAQRLGYAETNPTLDVNGFDAACKLVILVNHVLKEGLSLKDVNPVEGIEGITAEAVRKAAARGRTVRLVARMRLSPEVSVMEVDARGALSVKGASNSVVFYCKDSGERVIAGPAAGAVTTSHAVLRDLITLAALEKEKKNR
jgi:homoserine dehydrogenase